MASVNIYLNFKGNCREAFNFYKSVFRKEFDHISTFGEAPKSDDIPAMPDEMNDQVMHVSLPIGEGTMIMGSDTGGDWAPDFKQGNNFSISVDADTKAEADRMFAELAEGGQITMSLGEPFWGGYFGMCTDKFGINWMMSFDEGRQK